MPSTILLPVEVAREQQVSRENEAVQWIREQLKCLDSRLDIVRASEKADAFGLVPGCWHLHRRNDGAPDSYLPICGPNGEYVEPHSGIVEELRRRDMWKKGALKQIMREYDQRKEAEEKRIAHNREAAKDDFRKAVKAYDSPGVLISDDVPFKAHNAGRIDKKAA